MIFVAAGLILFSAVGRFIHPTALDGLGLGVAISAAATVINAAVGLVLIRVGRRERSVTLTADGKHLMTDACPHRAAGRRGSRPRTCHG